MGVVGCRPGEEGAPAAAAAAAAAVVLASTAGSLAQARTYWMVAGGCMVMRLVLLLEGAGRDQTAVVGVQLVGYMHSP